MNITTIYNLYKSIKLIQIGNYLWQIIKSSRLDWAWLGNTTKLIELNYVIICFCRDVWFWILFKYNFQCNWSTGQLSQKTFPWRASLAMSNIFPARLGIKPYSGTPQIAPQHYSAGMSDIWFLTHLVLLKWLEWDF
jgi:hypothetical protein